MESLCLNNFLEKKLLETREEFLSLLGSLKERSILIRSLCNRNKIDLDYEIFFRYVLDPNSNQDSDCVELEAIVRIINYVCEDGRSFLENYHEKYLSFLEKPGDEEKSDLAIEGTIKLFSKVYNFFKWYGSVLLDIMYCVDSQQMLEVYRWFRIFPGEINSLLKKWSSLLNERFRVGKSSPLTFEIPIDLNEETRSLQNTPRGLPSRDGFKRTHSELRINLKGIESSSPRTPRSLRSRITPHSENVRRNNSSPTFRNSRFSPRGLWSSLFNRRDSRS